MQKLAPTIIEGYFTQQEIDMALAHGAIRSDCNNKTILSFKSNDDYTNWFENQKKLNPEIWSTINHIPINVL